MRNIIPFIVKYSPIKKLAIIPFEKKPDKIYKGFELQFLHGDPYGNGYRVIAYRNDNYVDVYDDLSLSFQKDERFNVAENGLNKHTQTSIENVCFDKQNNCECISFSFKDIENRKIDFYLKESSKKKTTPMNLLAPIGYGSKSPNFLPLFFMYDFDFIRRKNTKINCTIDDKVITIEKFPMPMNLQYRFYARYSNNCELLEFANTDILSLKEIESQEGSYFDKNTEYVFDDSNSLSNIIVHLEQGKIDINFYPSFNMNTNSKGSFIIQPKKEMGFIEGIYEVERNDFEISIKLIPNGGWTSVPNSNITKLILKSNSIFCRWSRNYEFNELIDIEKKVVKAEWINNN